MAKLITFLVALQLLMCIVSADEDNFIVPDGVSHGGVAWGGRSSLIAFVPPFCCKLKCHCCREQLNKQEDAFAVVDGVRTKETPGGEAAGGGDARKDADEEEKGGVASMEAALGGGVLNDVVGKSGVVGAGAALGAGVHKDVGGDSGSAGVGAALSGGAVRKNADGGKTGVSRRAASGGRARKNTGGGQTGVTGNGAPRHNFTMPAEGKTDSASSVTGVRAAWGVSAVVCKPPNCCKYKCSCCTEQLNKQP